MLTLDLEAWVQSCLCHFPASPLGLSFLICPTGICWTTLIYPTIIQFFVLGKQAWVTDGRTVKSEAAGTPTSPLNCSQRMLSK